MDTNEKRTLKDWWKENKSKIGIAALSAFGVFCVGFIKGVDTSTRMFLDNVEIREKESDPYPTEEEQLADDPELMELIKMEEEA